MNFLFKSSEEHFWARVNKQGPIHPQLGQCWQWILRPSAHGYPYLSLGRSKNVRAHRFAYELLVGPIPLGLTIDHLCENKMCVNPKHLEPTTIGENARRASEKTHCLRGHKFTTQNGRHVCKQCKALTARLRRQNITSKHR